MKIRTKLFALGALMTSGALLAQEPVVGVDDPESLFTDDDPQLHENKQAALHIMRELLQCNRWDEAENWLTERYIQHNPNAASGRESVVRFFSAMRERSPGSCDELTTPIVAVLADDDLVTVVWPLQCQHPETGERYTSTWFDMWRFVDGKADEHWDPALKNTPTGCTPGAPPAQ